MSQEDTRYISPEEYYFSSSPGISEVTDLLIFNYVFWSLSQVINSIQ